MSYKLLLMLMDQHQCLQIKCRFRRLIFGTTDYLTLAHIRTYIHPTHTHSCALSISKPCLLRAHNLVENPKGLLYWYVRGKANHAIFLTLQIITTIIIIIITITSPPPSSSPSSSTRKICGYSWHCCTCGER